MLAISNNPAGISFRVLMNRLNEIPGKEQGEHQADEQPRRGIGPSGPVSVERDQAADAAREKRDGAIRFELAHDAARDQQEAVQRQDGLCELEHGFPPIAVDEWRSIVEIDSRRVRNFRDGTLAGAVLVYRRHIQLHAEAGRFGQNEVSVLYDQGAVHNVGHAGER